MENDILFSTDNITSRNSVGKRHRVFLRQLQRDEGPPQRSADKDQGRSAARP